MKRRTMALGISAIVAVPSVAFAATKEELRAEVRKAGEEALAAVYKVQGNQVLQGQRFELSLPASSPCMLGC